MKKDGRFDPAATAGNWHPFSERPPAGKEIVTGKHGAAGGWIVTGFYPPGHSITTADNHNPEHFWAVLPDWVFQGP